MMVCAVKVCTKCKQEKPREYFWKDKRLKSGLASRCISCLKLQKAKWNKTKTALESNTRYRQSEGYCVYKVEYPSGLYIGSGATVARRMAHLSGNSAIAKQLNQKAILFKTLIKGTKSYCIEMETKLIELYGLNNLLNTKGKGK